MKKRCGDCAFQCLSLTVKRIRLCRSTWASTPLRYVSGAEASFYPESGHMPFWEESVCFNRELAAFVIKATGRT